MFKMSTLCAQYTPDNDVEYGQVSKCKASIFWARKIRWTLNFSIPISREHSSFGIVKKPAWLQQNSRYQWNFSFFLTDLSTHLPTFHRLQTCLGFLLLLLLLVVEYRIQLFKVVELQQHSPLSSNTSVTTYIHRMIISPPCLFEHTKNDGRVAMLSQCLLDHIQQKLYFCLISLLRNNVSKSVYIKLRYSIGMLCRLLFK